jgi:hypothetical protein
MAAAEPGGDRGSDRFVNVIAEDDAQVGTQIGVVHGDANFYKIAEGASPAEKYRVGLNYLNGNMPRQAEKLIREAMMNGRQSTESAYYLALAILSGRSFDQLAEPASSSNEHLTVLSQPRDPCSGRQILAQAEPGLLTLTPKRTYPRDRPSENGSRCS